MADSKTVAAQIAARCRRIGWDVTTAGGADKRTKWLYKIVPPTGVPVYLHSSPSDTNWEENVWRRLRKGGFDEAEAAWKTKQDRDKQAKLTAANDAVAIKTKAIVERATALTKAAGPYVPQPADLGWLLTPHAFPEHRTIIVTPEVAGKLLTLNTHNRKLRPGRVDFLARIILNGEWGVTHQGGAIDSAGVLQDGQHRLCAILEADMAVPMLWSVGMPPENFRKVDTNAPRTARDAAYIDGEPDPRSLTALAKTLIHIDMFGQHVAMKAGKQPLSNDEVDAFIKDHRDDMMEAISNAKEIKRELKKVNQTSLAAGIYLIHQAMPDGDPRVKQFIEDVQFGPAGSIQEKKSDPVYVLRRLLLNATAGQHNAWDQLAYVLKAWNYRAQKMAKTLLLYRRSAEPFPHVVMPEQLVADETEAA